MKFSEENKNALLMHIHQSIHDTTKFVLQKFKASNNDSLDYFVLTDEEEKLISSIKNSELLHSILKKILTRSLDDTFLQVLSVIDGVSEPLSEFGKKSDFLLIDKPEDFDEHYDFLHDEFFETYDTWEKINSMFNHNKNH